MKCVTSRRLAKFLLLASFLVTTAAQPARAEAGMDVVPLLGARWLQRDAKPTIEIPLASALSRRQRSIIEGGFTTLTQLTLRLPDPEANERLPADDSRLTLPIVHRVRCTVKFDAWEETYDVARLEGISSDGSAQPALVKDFEEYGGLCLTAELEHKEFLERFRSGGYLLAWLVVKQTSRDEAARIKEWLIQQQSGVMQGLFSHMLGELTLNQSVLVRILIPPRPALLEDSFESKSKVDAIMPVSTKG